jgi:hypothetical protein
MILLLLGCDGEPAACPAVEEGLPTCPMDACAQTCGGLECCIEAYGRGLEGQDLDTLLSQCEGDACDPDPYLSAAAAMCAAQVQGFNIGIDACSSSLVWTTSLYWRARNDMDLPCEDSLDLEGTNRQFYLDPVTGEFVYESWAMYQVNGCSE